MDWLDDKSEWLQLLVGGAILLLMLGLTGYTMDIIADIVKPIFR